MDQSLQGSFDGSGRSDLRNHNSMVSYRLSNINKIFKNLEKSNRKHKSTSATDTTLLHENVNALMSKVSDDSNDLSKGLGSIVDTFDITNHDTEDLESILENEQQRSKNILRLASYLDNQVHKIYQGVNDIFNQVEKGRFLPKGFQDSVNSKFNVVHETIDSMAQVASSSPRDVERIMDKAGKDIALANLEVKLIEQPTLNSVSDSMSPETVINSEIDGFNEPSADWSPVKRGAGEEVLAVIPAPTMFDAECQTDQSMHSEEPNQTASVEPSPTKEIG